MTIAIPVLESERLVLREHRREDLPDCAAMWGDPAVTRHIGGRPFSDEEVWARLLRARGHWDIMGFGYWVVRERASDRFVGEVGFGSFRRATEPPIGDAPELGWALAPWCWGRGFATEAVGAALAFCDAQLDAERTICIIDPPNLASRRVAEKHGFTALHPVTYHGAETVLFERIRTSGRR